MRAGRKLVYFSNLQWLLLSFMVMFLDFITKYWVISNCVLDRSIFITSFMNFHYVYNFGMAFSLFSEFAAKQSYILLSITIFIILLLCVALCFIDGSYGCFFKIAYAIIIGGALGNLIDRIRYGVVVDFIDCHICDWHFPTFNIADLSIFIGVVMMILYNYR